MNISALTEAEREQNLNATVFMQQLRQRFNRAENHHEFYIADALKMVHFDGSLDSFKRLDQMFVAYRKKMGVLSEDFMQDPRKLNSLLLIASYMGCFISKKLGIAESWQNNKQVKNPARTTPLYPNDAIHSYSLNCHHHTLLPIQYIIQHFCDAELKHSISQEIEAIILHHHIQRAEETGHHTEEMHAIQYMYQKQYPEVAHPAYQKLIQLSKLDYSIHSLERFDDLMRELRQNHIVSAESFLKKTPNLYFVLYLSGYLGRVIAQETGAHLEWLSASQAAKLSKDTLENQLPICRIAQINSVFLRVTQHICDFLFSPSITRTSKKYAQAKIGLIQTNHFPRHAIADTRQNSQKFKTSPFCATFYQAGLLTGYLLQQLHGVFPPYSSKELLIPTSYPAGTTIFQHSEGLEKALRLFENNAEQHPYNVLGYKSSANLPHLRCDAIALDIQHEGKFPIRLHLVIPYISSFDYRGFHILQPYLWSKDSKTEQQMEKIMQSMGALFDGIDAFEAAYPQGIRNWRNYYKPQLFPYPIQFK